MADHRTEEQRTADEALTAAVEQTMSAYGWGGLLTDYVITLIGQDYDADGVMQVTTGLLSRDDAVPHYRMLGLLRCATMQVEQGFVTAPDLE